MTKKPLWIAIAALFAATAFGVSASPQDEYADEAAIEEMSEAEVDATTVTERETPAAASQRSMDTATYPIPTGTLTARSEQPPPKPGEHVPPANVAELDQDGDGLISESEARGNLALINDFIHVDRNRDHKVSASELARWKRG